MAFVLRVAKMMWLWLAGGFALLRHTRGFQTIRWFHVKALNISLVNATQIQGEETLRWDDCGAIPCRFFNLRGKATNNELWQDRNKRQTQFNERNFKCLHAWYRKGRLSALSVQWLEAKLPSQRWNAEQPAVQNEFWLQSFSSIFGKSVYFLLFLTFCTRVTSITVVTV